MAEYIHGQKDARTAGIRWGRFSTIGRSGCGAVAAYNAAVALGRNPEFLEIVREMEQKHMPSCGGICGMNVFRLKFWLQKKFGRTELFFLNTEEWDRETRSCRAVVLFYRNKGVFKGNHFITGVRTQGDFVFYNAGVLPENKAVSMDEALKRLRKAGHTPLFLIVL